MTRCHPFSLIFVVPINLIGIFYSDTLHNPKLFSHCLSALYNKADIRFSPSILTLSLHFALFGKYQRISCLAKAKRTPRETIRFARQYVWYRGAKPMVS